MNYTTFRITIYWILIKQFQSSRLLDMFHVRAHMDKHLKDAYKAQGKEHSDDEIYELLTPDWKGNYHADEQADNMHRSGELLPNNGLCELQEVATYARNEPLLVALPIWIRGDVRSINSMRHWNEHPDLTNGIKVDWKCMKSVTAGHRYLHQRIRFMKVLTDTFAYSQRRMQWRLLAPSKNNVCTAIRLEKRSSTCPQNVRPRSWAPCGKNCIRTSPRY